tara:strand:- start:526 stop:813 length:288 start_codon:yes stop_codon:yes gene_type:complete
MKKDEIQELDSIMDFILSCNRDDLNSIAECVKDRKKIMNSKLKYLLRVGQTVTISGTGKFEEGVIEKVNKARAIVKVQIDGKSFTYNVPFSMIRA